MHISIGHKTVHDALYKLLCTCMFSTKLGSQWARFADVLVFVETGVLRHYLA